MNPEHRHEAWGLAVSISNLSFEVSKLAGRVRKGRKQPELAKALAKAVDRLQQAQKEITNQLEDKP